MVKAKRLILVLAALSGFSAVALGAFGAHILSDRLTSRMLEVYNTGVLYHLVHSVVLLAIALSNYKLTKSFWFIFIGIILFSFSLYVYTITGITFLAIITPFGGVSFLIGWLMIIYEVFKIKKKINSTVKFM